MDNSAHMEHFFQILGDANRLKIIKFIGLQERTVSEIVAFISLSQPLVSHHLRVLKTNSILETKREGPFIYYKLINQRLLDVLGLFTQVLPKEIGTDEAMPMFPFPSWCMEFMFGKSIKND